MDIPRTRFGRGFSIATRHPSALFTTLSGVGNGDIMPLSAPARVLVMLEQFAGVGYIATVVSRLIGLTILRQRDLG